MPSTSTPVRDLDLGLTDSSVMVIAEREEAPVLTFDFEDFRAAPSDAGPWPLVVDESRYLDSTNVILIGTGAVSGSSGRRASTPAGTMAASAPATRSAVRDPREGVTVHGTITTGASRDAIDPAWLPVLSEARRQMPETASLYVYGSVATGTAVSPSSDVDLLTLDLPAHEADRISAELSERHRRLCRAVSIAPASSEALRGESDEGYGLRVFLRHYCVHLVGDDPGVDLLDYPADRRAARGFNGDIAQHRAAWLDDLRRGADPSRLGTRIARKTLLALAGIVSLREGTWTTDRRAAADMWAEPHHSVAVLRGWLDEPPTDASEVRDALLGCVAHIERTFAREIGLWRS